MLFNRTDREEFQKQLEQFKVEALEETGLTGHPKADQAFYLAWKLANGSARMLFSDEDNSEKEIFRDTKAVLMDLRDLLLGE
jgi:hypothetical protein